MSAGGAVMTYRLAYDAVRATILTVAVGIAVWTMTGALDGPLGSSTLPQTGHTVTSYDSSRTTFNPDATLDRTQVGR